VKEWNWYFYQDDIYWYLYRDDFYDGDFLLIVFKQKVWLSPQMFHIILDKNKSDTSIFVDLTTCDHNCAEGLLTDVAQ